MQGQYLTFRRDFDGTEIRRSYSICSAPGAPLQVGIKRVEGGAFSAWANEALAPGDRLDAMPPTGRFHAAIAPDAERHYLLVAAGSGITPILSIARTVLDLEPRSRVTLLYANRAVNQIMFLSELDDLKSRHLARLAIVHVLKQDAQDIPLFTGRIDAGKLDALFAGWIDVETVDLAFICGPEGLMRTVAASLEAHGMPKDAIRFELFGASPDRPSAEIGPPGRAGQAPGGDGADRRRQPQLHDGARSDAAGCGARERHRRALRLPGGRLLDLHVPGGGG